MKFPWHKYEEVPLRRRNTLQVFITNACNLSCEGCFAESTIKENNLHMRIEEYEKAIANFLKKGGKQINLLGGEPLIHPKLKEIMAINKSNEIKTTIYTNGNLLNRFKKEDFKDAKLRVSLYSLDVAPKAVLDLPTTDIPIDANFFQKNYVG